MGIMDRFSQGERDLVSRLGILKERTGREEDRREVVVPNAASPVDFRAYGGNTYTVPNAVPNDRQGPIAALYASIVTDPFLA